MNGSDDGPLSVRTEMEAEVVTEIVNGRIDMTSQGIGLGRSIAKTETMIV